jgi:hypothetical protein
VEAIEHRAARRNGIDMRGAQNRVAITPEKIGALLIGNEQKEIRAGRFRHFGVPMRLSC